MHCSDLALSQSGKAIVGMYYGCIDIAILKCYADIVIYTDVVLAKSLLLGE